MGHSSAIAAATNQFVIVLGARGRLVLPAKVREQYGLDEGDRLVLTAQPNGILQLASLRDQARAMRGVFRDTAPGRSLTDELIADRRDEARREEG